MPERRRRFPAPAPFVSAPAPLKRRGTCAVPSQMLLSCSKFGPRAVGGSRARKRSVAALDTRRSVHALLSFGLVTSGSAFPHSLRLIPHQPFFVVGQRRIGDLTRANAVRPIGRTNGSKAREAARAAFQPRKSDGDQGPRRRHLIQIRDAFGLYVV